MKINKYIILIFAICELPFCLNAYNNTNSDETTINVVNRLQNNNNDLTEVDNNQITIQESVNVNDDEAKSEIVEKEKPTEIKKNNSTSSSQVIIKENNISIEEELKKKKDILGTRGRLYIPSVKFSVAIYYAIAEDGSDYNAQEIVDKKDSAAYFHFETHEMIADHNYQGFNKIIDLPIGTKAYIKLSDENIMTYELTAKNIGKNLGADIVNSEGESIADINDSLIMYTCYDSSNSIMITFWDIKK